MGEGEIGRKVGCRNKSEGWGRGEMGRKVWCGDESEDVGGGGGIGRKPMNFGVCIGRKVRVWR